MSGVKFFAGTKAYSPAGIIRILRETIGKENGNIEAVLTKSKHKKIVELWYGCYFAVATYRRLGEKYFILPSENPDLHFIKNMNRPDQMGFSVEIMTLFDHAKPEFDGDYKKIAKKVWDKKGMTDYDRTELLLVSRLNGDIDIDKLATELVQFKWRFLSIWLSVFNSENSEWSFFDIVPYQGSGRVGKISVKSTDLPY